MILLETHERVPRSDTADFVQRCLDEGAVVVVVTPNSDGCTCTVSVQRD